MRFIVRLLIILISILLSASAPAASGSHDNTPASKKATAKQTQPPKKNTVTRRDPAQAPAAKTRPAPKTPPARKAAEAKPSPRHQPAPKTAATRAKPKPPPRQVNKPSRAKAGLAKSIPEPVDYKSAGGTASWEQLDPDRLNLSARAVLVVDQQGNRIYGKGIDQVMPIASITKLMTAMVTLDAGLPMDEEIHVTQDDRELLGINGSRLKRTGVSLDRSTMLRICLMSSENIAAAALARTTFPGGMPAFIEAMNRKAQALGMTNTHYRDPTGLNPGNVSTPEDLVKLLRAARHYPLIREATTTASMQVSPFDNSRTLQYANTNPLVRAGNWDIQISKTGFINPAGHCLVMTATIYDRTLDIVLLNAAGRHSHFADSIRLRNWIAAEGKRS